MNTLHNIIFAGKKNCNLVPLLWFNVLQLYCSDKHTVAPQH